MIKKILNKVSLEDLEKFLNKIDQLNNLVELINKCPEKKKNYLNVVTMMMSLD